MVSSGFSEEFVGVDFNDKRLNARLLRTAETLGEHCFCSIPAAADGRAEMEAIYRLIDNEKVSPQKLKAPHRRATLERIHPCDVALLVHDTTELDVTRPSQQVNGAGPLSHVSRRGSYYHPLMAFTDEGLALGTVWSKHWVRERIQTGVTREEKRRIRHNKAIEDKESFRWVEAVRAGLETSRECPDTQCVIISDSESDIYEVLAEPRETTDGVKLDLIIRAAGNRQLADCDEKVLERLRSSPCLFRSTVDISKRIQKTNVTESSPRKKSRDGRIAEVEVRAASVVIQAPCKGSQRQAVKYNIVLVEEPTPPPGADPIQWVLITSLPIDTPEDVQRIIDYYCHRWQIEIYFRVLKSGCRIQERYFETMRRLENCLALYVVIAWKILYLSRLGQKCPDLPCDIIFSESEWKSVYTIVKHKPAPKQVPTINEIIRMIASLGGYVIRNKTRPGTQSLWIGIQRAFDFANAWDAFGPGYRTRGEQDSFFDEHTCVER